MAKRVDWTSVVRSATESQKERITATLQGAVSQSLEQILSEFPQGGVDLTEVEALIDRKVGDLEAKIERVSSKTPRPIVVKIEAKGVEKKVEGITHKNFTHLLKMVGARLNVALIGEAGSGKTHATEQVAEALGLNYFPMSFHAKMTATDLRGYMDANGKYNASALYLAMKQGGVLCLDEFDRSNTEVTVSLNNVLASGKYLFPNGELVSKHPDFVVVACQNTTGMGASKQYAAAQRQDASTLNRFVKLEWNVDEDMETAICGDNDITKAVQKIRAKARDLGMDIVVSPRQSIHANTLVGLGYKVDDALRYSIFECLAPDQVKRLKECL